MKRVRAEVDDVISGVTRMAGGEPRSVTWRELAEEREQEVRRLSLYRAVLSDLSRCEHGRHFGDVCSGCGGPSHGNAYLPPAARIGSDISGRPIIVPAKAQFAKAEEWRDA